MPGENLAKSRKKSPEKMKTNPEASQMRHTTNIKHTPCATAKAPREREKKRSEDVEPVKEIH